MLLKLLLIVSSYPSVWRTVLIDAYIHHNVPIANIVVCERNKDETKLLIGCENGTLVSLYMRASTV